MSRETAVPTRRAAAVSPAERELWPQLGGAIEQFRVLDTGTVAGTVFGETRSGKPVSLHLLRPAPVRVVVVGRAWLASLLAIRCAALGAGVVIASDNPAPWTALTRVVGGRVPFATVVAGDARALPAPSVVEPVCVLHDAGAGEALTARGPWHTSVHLLPSLTERAAPLVNAADLILVPRPTDEQLDATLDLLRLPAAMADKLAAMPSSDSLAVTRSRALFVTVQASPTEKQILQSSR